MNRNRLAPFLVALLICAALGAIAAKAAPTERQVAKSQSTLRFFDNHLWLTAPNHKLCITVPWTRSCLIARERVRFHTRRLELFERTIPVSNDWRTAVFIVQRAFPNTADVLLSCSSAEGAHGAWVLYGGRPYYPGAEYARTFHGWMVGGPMQYMWPTFKGHYRHGLDSLRERGFKVNLPPVSDVAAWRSMTAQAIAAGWAFWSGNDNSHWSASSGSC